MVIEGYARNDYRGEGEQCASEGMVFMIDDTRERLITLEVEVRHLQAQLSDTAAKVNEMHALLMQARGARWVIVALAALAGFFASFLTKFIPGWR
jgi:hypothetical protein